MSATRAEAVAVLRSALAELDLEVEEPAPGRFVVVLPGERKQRTTVSLLVGEHALTVQAFVARHVDENAEAVYRWLLERNLRTYGMAFSVDALGDIYLTGRLPLTAVTADEVDRLLGSVLDNADGSFDTILELGFGTAIRREWEWRLARGESTANLQAFRHLAPPEVAGSSVVAPAFVRLAELAPGASTSVVLRAGQAVVLLPPADDDPAAWTVHSSDPAVLEAVPGGPEQRHDSGPHGASPEGAGPEGAGPERGSGAGADGVVLNPGALALAAGRAELAVTAPDGTARTVVVVVEPPVGHR